jgi:hypothetical protein
MTVHQLKGIVSISSTSIVYANGLRIRKNARSAERSGEKRNKEA